MVESPLALPQVQLEGVRGHAVELLQTALGEAPEALDPVDVRGASGELILLAMEPDVLGEADFHQAVIATQVIGVDRARELYPSSDPK